MSTLTMELSSVKNIKNAKLEIPLEKGIYCFAGRNACGKSTIMACLGRLVVNYSLNSLIFSEKIDQSIIQFKYQNSLTQWKYNLKNKNWHETIVSGRTISFKGMYEGSFFYGTRFKDSQIIDKILKQHRSNIDEIIADAPDYVKSNLSFILHGNYEVYNNLKKLKQNKDFLKKFRNVPYFNMYSSQIVSQYKMSSGECLLISLLDFINNVVVKKDSPQNLLPRLVVIDEIETALHPVAIDRLITFLNEMIAKTNLVVILTSHSPEVITRINHNNLYMLEMQSNNELKVINPCYPSYAIRAVYKHDGFDFIILVEDLLAKYFVEHIIAKNNANASKLINVLPVGGWENVLKLHQELRNNNSFGIGTKIISILDGDINREQFDAYSALPILSLPIQSIEKFLKLVVSETKYFEIRKEINDRFFVVNTIDSIYSECIKRNSPDGKPFYKMLIQNLEQRRISEDSFIHGLVDIIDKNIDIKKFSSNLLKILNQ